MAIYIRECIQCGAAFKGGPRAWYCPVCREERQRAQQREAKRRKKEGKVRSIGSTDICQRCGKPYTVDSGLQKYCPDCREEAMKELDRTQSLEYYHENKEQINPRRNIKRAALPRRCPVCGNDFKPRGPQKYCSAECKNKMFKPLQPAYDKNRKRNKEKE